MLSTDIAGAPGQTYRLYQAAFARTPDSAGLSINYHALVSGFTLHDLAYSFVSSAEFGNRYGQNISDTDFVTRLYNNVLHRDPDLLGIAGWLKELQRGTMDRAQVLIGFSESDENHRVVDPSLSAGVPLDDTISRTGIVQIGGGSKDIALTPQAETILFGLNFGDIASATPDQTAAQIAGVGYWGNTTSGTGSGRVGASTSATMTNVTGFTVDGPNHDVLQFMVSSWDQTNFRYGATQHSTMLINGDGTANAARAEPLASSTASTPFVVTRAGAILPTSSTHPELVVLDAIRAFTNAADLAASLSSPGGAVTFATSLSGADRHLLFGYVATDGDVRIADVNIHSSGSAYTSTASGGLTVTASDMVRLVGIHSLDAIALHPEDISFTSQQRLTFIGDPGF